MDYIGGVDGIKFTPITNYNNYLKENKALDVEINNSDFENVLQQKSHDLQASAKVQGGVQMNNFEDLIAQSSVQKASDDSPTGNFMKSFSKSLNSGLTEVNNNVDAANKAQEAMAMGEDVSVHDVMIAAEKASLSLQMAMQLRNKLLNAYSEINNVRV